MTGTNGWGGFVTGWRNILMKARHFAEGVCHGAFGRAEPPLPLGAQAVGDGGLLDVPLDADGAPARPIASFGSFACAGVIDRSRVLVVREVLQHFSGSFRQSGRAGLSAAMLYLRPSDKSGKALLADLGHPG